MRKVFTICLTLIIFGSISGQSIPRYALLKYDVQVDLNIVMELDKRKLHREKDKTLRSEIMSEQLDVYRNRTFDFFNKEIVEAKKLDFADRYALEDFFEFDEEIPCPLFPKRVVKKKCKKAPYEFFVITTVRVRKPAIKLAGNIMTVSTEIKVLNKDGGLVKTLKKDLKLDEPIRSRDFEGKFDKLYRSHYDMLFEKLQPYIEKSILETYESFTMA